MSRLPIPSWARDGEGRLNRIDCHVAEFILSTTEGLLAMTGLQLDVSVVRRDAG
jgi:hypothetical protein